MFWSYAGNIGAGHHLGVEAVSSAVGESWLVGGVSGTLAAMLVAKRVPLTFTIIVSAIGGAAGTCAAIMVGSEVAFSFVLMVFVFFWNVMYPIQMGFFAEVDPSGQLAMLAWFVQLIACAIGPALGGFVLHVSSYNALGLSCALGYLLFVAATLMLAPMAKRSSARVS
jgi:predicted MFS family arabinose efflux permease